MKIIKMMVLVLLASFGTQAQSTLGTDKCVSDVYLSLNGAGITGRSASLADFRSLAPSSVLLANFNESGYSRSDYYSGRTGTFTAAVGINFKNKETGEYRANPQLRLGMTYENGSMLYTNYWQDTRSPFDTLISQQTGEEFYIDSVFSQSFVADYQAQNLQLDASLIWRTNPAARWSLYGGLGVAGGVGFNAQTRIYYSESSYIQDVPQERYLETYNYEDARSEEEVVDAPNHFLLTAYLPLGVDFRIGNTSDFWQRVHLFWEMRPGVQMLFAEDIDTQINPRLQGGLGVRVNF